MQSWCRPWPGVLLLLDLLDLLVLLDFWIWQQQLPAQPQQQLHHSLHSLRYDLSRCRP